MPRDSSGVYSLPAGNPVVTATVISSTWANSTLEDIADALSDSLSRSGDGAMTAPLELTAGSAAAPSLTFSTDTNTGIYLDDPDEIGFSCGGAVTWIMDGSFNLGAASAANCRVRNGTGTVASPSYSFSTDTNSGFYAIGADNIGLSLGGTLRVNFSTSHMEVALGISSTGNGGNPSLSSSSVWINGGNSGQITQVNVLAAANNRAWDSFVDNSGSLFFRSVNDAFNSSNTWLSVGRSGVTVTGIDLSTGGFSSLNVGQYNAGSFTIVTIGPVSGSTGMISLRNYSTTTSVGLAGGASALPATPQGYLTVTVNGSNMRIPYYNV